MKEEGKQNLKFGMNQRMEKNPSEKKEAKI